MYWYYNLGDYSFIFYILAFGIMIWSLIVRGRLNRLVKKYSDVPVASGKDANTPKTEKSSLSGMAESLKYQAILLFRKQQAQLSEMLYNTHAISF